MTEAITQVTKDSRVQETSSEDVANRVSPVSIDLYREQVNISGFHDLLNLPIDPHEDDPMKQACPTGGCPPDKKLNQDIYWDSLQTDAKITKANLQDPTQRREVHMRVVDSMRPRVRENRKFEKQDREGPPSAQGPEFILKDGGIFYPDFNKSLRQMQEDLKRLRPELYDPREDATLTLMEETFIRGATRVEHVSFNKDNKGNEAIRDKIIMRWDPVTQKGTMEIQNIALDGKPHSVEGAFGVMSEDTSGAVFIHPAQGVGIFADKPLPTEEISLVVSSYDFEAHSIAVETVDTLSYAGQRLKDDTNEVLEIARDRIIEELEEKNIYLPPYLQRLLGFSKEHQDQHEAQHSMILLEQRLSSFFQEIIIDEISKGPKNESIFIQLRKQIEQSLNISPEQSKMLLIQLQENWKATQDTAKTIEFVKEMGVGTAGAIELIESIMRLQSESGESNKRVDGEIAEDVVFTWFSSFMEKIKDAKPEEAMAMVVGEEEKTLENVTTLWIVLLSLAQKDGPRIQNDLPTHVPEEEMSLEEKEAVEHFQLAVVVWFLLKLASYYDGLTTLRDRLVGQKESIRRFISGKTDSVTTEEVKQHIPEALIQQETTHWILFAIIWYLAMIREQSKAHASSVTYHVSGKKKTAKKKIHPTGIIFAFAS